MDFPFFFFIFLFCAYAGKNGFAEERRTYTEITTNTTTVKKTIPGKGSEVYSSESTVKETLHETDVSNTDSPKISHQNEAFKRKLDKMEQEIKDQEKSGLFPVISDDYTETNFAIDLKIILALVCTIICIVGILLLIPAILRISRRSMKLEIRQSYANM